MHTNNKPKAREDGTGQHDTWPDQAGQLPTEALLIFHWEIFSVVKLHGVPNTQQHWDLCIAGPESNMRLLQPMQPAQAYAARRLIHATTSRNK